MLLLQLILLASPYPTPNNNNHHHPLVLHYEILPLTAHFRVDF